MKQMGRTVRQLFRPFKFRKYLKDSDEIW